MRLAAIADYYKKERSLLVRVMGGCDHFQYRPIFERRGK